MSILRDMPELINYTVVISKKGAVTGSGPAGPIYAADVECYNDEGAFWLLSSQERIIYDKIGNPATHQLVIHPDKITSTITDDATATIDGVTYNLYALESDIMGLGEVATYGAKRLV